MKSKAKLLIILLFISAYSKAQTKLIEKVQKKGEEIIIPYEKYRLPNGLTLIIHEDHSDPVVHVDVTYHVGSAREEIGKSGFAHFFEHMMFQGSDHVADEEHFKIVTEAGGTLNGSTNRDRTNYYETVPSNQLETILWLEADRMGFFLDAVTQKKFEIQRATVKNERGQNYDNRPYGLVGEVTGKNLYPYGHPYSWLTIGYIEDLNRVNVNDLKNFFLRWYGPNNAVLTVGGDVNPQEVLKLVEKYFGVIPKGPEVKPTQLQPFKIEKDRYVSYVDNYIRLPMLRMTFPSVPSYHEDEPALDCLSEIIGQGKNSILYKNFIKTQKATQASAFNPCTELAGEFTFTVVPFPGQTLADMEALLRASIKEFEEKGVEEDALKRFKANYESGLIQGLNSVAGKVSTLAQYETLTGNANYIQNQYKKHMSLTREDVMRAYDKYIKNKPALILSVLNKDNPQGFAKADDYTVSTEGYKPGTDEYKGLSYTKPTDKFDRSIRPKPSKNPSLTVPPYWTDKLENGIEIIGTKTDETPSVTLLFSIKGGHRLSEENPSKSGISTLTASLMNEDTENYTAEQMSNELDKLGSSISFFASAEDVTVYVNTLTKNIDATLKLLEERLYRPKFEEDDFNRLKKQQLEGINNQNTQPTVIAGKVYNKLLYGSNHIMAIPTSGTVETVNNITLEDVKTYYKKYYSASVTDLVIVGNLSKDNVIPKLAFLKKWEAKPVKLPEDKAPAPIGKTKIYLVDKQKAAQSEIRIGYIAMPYDATGEYYKAGLMNYNLGGAFNSRININLREDKGWTYGAGSYFSGSKYKGSFTSYGGIKANATDSAIREFVKEITEFKSKGIKEEELSFMKSSIGQRDALKYETPFQKASFLSRIIEYKLEKDFVDKQNAILKNISKKEIDELAKKHLPVDKMHIVVVGDKEVIKAGLEKLPYEIVELDAEGNELKSPKPEKLDTGK